MHSILYSTVCLPDISPSSRIMSSLSWLIRIIYAGLVTFKSGEGAVPADIEIFTCFIFTLCSYFYHFYFLWQTGKYL